MRARKIFTKNFGFKSIFFLFLPIFPQNYPLPIFDKFSQNSPFYCNFWSKMVEKMRIYKELGNNALPLKLPTFATIQASTSHVYCLRSRPIYPNVVSQFISANSN